MTVTSPWGIGHLHLLPLSCEFQRAYPDIGLRLLLTDNVLNPVENGVDLSIRIGPLSDSSSDREAHRIGAGGRLREFGLSRRLEDDRSRPPTSLGTIA